MVCESLTCRSEEFFLSNKINLLSDNKKTIGVKSCLFNYFATFLLPHSTLLRNGGESQNGYRKISKKSEERK